MSILYKCKMCGADLELEPENRVCECAYCGTSQTVPTADNDKKMTLFGQANGLLRRCEFDRAADRFDQIITDFPEEAEAYWGKVLCEYGVEYVDDPATGHKVPTCHRSSFESVLESSDFESAVDYADLLARRVYREEAKQLEQLRTGILAVSAKEPPYDIFICYKETDPITNERTIDSVLAQDVYDALCERGYRVFFSRITLEDKLGTQYEPYIFAALNSAKVMLAFGTDPEFYSSVWVKNEWSRFLKLTAKDHSRYLIPCYKGMDPYDLPREFRALQAQDLGKIGATQDLLRGIDKLLGHTAYSIPKQEPAVPQAAEKPIVNGEKADPSRIHLPPLPEWPKKQELTESEEKAIHEARAAIRQKSEKELAEREAEITRLLDDRLRKYKAALSAAEKEEQSAKEAYDSAQSTIDLKAIQAELDRIQERISHLGIFSGREKRELLAKTDELEKRRHSEKEKLDEVIRKYNNASANRQKAQEALDSQLSKGLDLSELISAQELIFRTDVTEAKTGDILYAGYQMADSVPVPIGWQVLGKKGEDLLLLSDCSVAAISNSVQSGNIAEKYIYKLGLTDAFPACFHDIGLLTEAQLEEYLPKLSDRRTENCWWLWDTLSGDGRCVYPDGTVKSVDKNADNIHIRIFMTADTLYSSLENKFFFQGYTCEEKHQEEEALTYYQKGAEVGDTFCMMKYGRHLINTPENQAEGLQLIRRSLSLGCKAATAAYADCLYDGAGMEQDHTQALLWYRMYFSACPKSAGHNLSSLKNVNQMLHPLEEKAEKMLAEGEEARAFYTYLEGAMQYSTSCMTNVIKFLYTGRGVEIDIDAAIKWNERYKNLTGEDFLEKLSSMLEKEENERREKEALAEQEAFLRKRAYNPQHIKSVTPYASNDSSRPLSATLATDHINIRQYSCISFKLLMNHEWGRHEDVNYGYIIYTEDGKCISDRRSGYVTIEPNYDKFAFTWIIRGSDGSVVPLGKYTMFVWFGDSRPVKVIFHVVK